MINDEAEILDLVDDNDQVVGTVSRTEAYGPNEKRGKYNLRAASCFIMNSQAELWIPKRQLHKAIMPGALDFSAGGHVSTGEDYITSMQRELYEETGIEATPAELHFIAKQIPADPGLLFYFQSVYLVYNNAVPDYNHDDFSGYEWVTIPQLITRLEGGEPAEDSILPAVRLLSAYLVEHNSNQ